MIGTIPSPTPRIINKHALERRLCLDSFYDFVLRFWSTIVPEPLIDNWHIKYICDEVQAVAERVLRREPKQYDLVINISPGTTKSVICSQMLPAWMWARDATIKQICGSYASDLSLHLAFQCRRIITSDKYMALFPEVQLISEGKELIQTDRGGQRIATSTNGRITGMHGHIIIVDDPINPREAVSDAMLQNATEWFDHTLMSRMVDRSITPIILIMQRLSQADPTGHFLERVGIPDATPIRHICLPAELSDSVRPRSMRKMYRDGLFDPVRLPKKILEGARIEMGEYAYAGQYGQDPIPLGGGMFRIDKFGIVTAVPSTVQIIRFWDKAGSAGKGAWTVGIKMGRTANKRFAVIDVVRGQWEAAQRERVIKNTAISDGKGVLIGIEQEPGSGGKESAQATVRNLAGFRVKKDRPVGDKALRADPYSVQVNEGNVDLVAGAWNQTYLHELQFFPFSKYKDQVDASSGAFSMLATPRIIAGAYK